MSTQLFTSRDRRLLLETLERLYVLELFNYDFFKKHSVGKKKTLLADQDRKYRTDLKAIEIILFKQQSKLFQNVKRPSIRQTLTIDARANGLL